MTVRVLALPRAGLRLPLRIGLRFGALVKLPDPYLVLIAAFVAALHVPSIHSYFHGDDFIALTDLVSKPALNHLEAVFLFKDANFYWRPLGEVYYLAVYSIGGLNPLAFHIGSIVIFEATLLLLYLLCRRWGMPRAVAAGACLILGVFPNHVVSVVWVTNAPRLLAMFFVVASLLEVERASRTRSVLDEAAAWLLFVAAGLSDETALALAPLPFLFAFTVRAHRESWRAITLRAIAYAAPAIALVPLQFMYTGDDEPRLADYTLGTHVLEQTWALASQLVLPLTGGGPMTESFASISPLQWTAGALAIALGGVMLLIGSNRMRVLVVWAALGLAPFTLWDIPYTAPRYVYMAAIPFSIAASWFGYALWQEAASRISIRPVRVLTLVPVAAVAVAIGFFGGRANVERNEAWAAATHPYQVLAEGLKTALPSVPSNSRIIIYYGVWDGFPLWPDAVVRTIYRDNTLDAVNVGRRSSEEAGPGRGPKDVVVYYADGRFIAVPNVSIPANAPAGSATTSR